MKKYLLLLVATLFSVSLSAQIIQGIWKGRDHQGPYKVLIGPVEKGGVVFEIETALMKAKGQFTEKGKLLTIKNAKGMVQLRRIDSEGEFKNKKGYLQFISLSDRISYKIVKGNLSLPGWEKDEASVVINHEER